MAKRKKTVSPRYEATEKLLHSEFRSGMQLSYGEAARGLCRCMDLSSTQLRDLALAMLAIRWCVHGPCLDDEGLAEIRMALNDSYERLSTNLN